MSAISALMAPAIIISALGTVTTLTGLVSLDRRFDLINPFNASGRNTTGLGLMILTGGLAFFTGDNQIVSKYSDESRNALKTSGIAVLAVGSGIGSMGMLYSSRPLLIGSLTTVAAGSLMIGFADDIGGIAKWPGE